MTLTARLPLVPPGAHTVTESLAIVRDGDRVVFFNAGGPIFSCDRQDRVGLRLAAVTVVAHGLAGASAVAAAVGLHRTTLFRDARKVKAHGVAGLAAKRHGPKGPHAVTPAVQRQAQRLLDAGQSIRATAAAVGLSDRGLRHAMARGLLTPRGRLGAAAGAAPVGPAVRAAEDQACAAGVAVKRTDERALACAGTLVEAAPAFQSAEAVAGAGVLLALPALLEQGLLDVGQAVYGGLRHGFFGLRSVLLTFAFMALRRLKTPEPRTEQAPGELGLLLGLDRVPEVKTLRRKLHEFGERRLARTFARALTERWAAAAPRELALLYVDGHVRPYHGRAHALPKHHVQQRGRPMPGTKDVPINDRRADPLLFVTAEATEGLLAILDAMLLPEVRRVVGPTRRVTLVFDREGWSPKRFAQWKPAKVDVLTYRKGKQTRWQARFFHTVSGTVGGETVEYRLAERTVTLSGGLRVREIRRLTDDGHQTAVITTNERLPLLAVAHRMFSRWRQENVFRYMRHEFALDHLCTYAVEPADPTRLVPSRERAALVKEVKAARAVRTTLVERQFAHRPDQAPRAGQPNGGEQDLPQRIRACDAEIDALTLRVAALPARVPISTLLKPDEIVELERERKVLVDAIKLTAYRAESALARLVEPFFARHEEEARKLLKSIFQATADIIPDRRAKRLTVRFHGLATPRATRALGDLCALANDHPPCYPNTDLRLHFEAPVLQG